MKVNGSLVFFIGNGEVKGGIIAREHNKLPKVITSRIRDLPFHTDRTRDQLEKRILQEFVELLSEMKTKDTAAISAKNLHIQDALVILSSPWYVSETSVIKMKEQKPFVVTDHFLETSRESVVKAYRNSHEVDVAILEQRILQISLNGYTTANPLKKRATELDMSIFTSFAKQSSLDEIRRIIDQNFHVPSIKIHSHSLAAFSILTAMWKNMNHYIIADITSELTELVVVRNGLLAEAASFPKGKKYILDAISRSLGVSSEVAVSFLKNKEAGDLEEGLSKKIDGALEVARKEWLTEFTTALSQISVASSLPKQFFLFAPKDSSRIFSEFILSESYQQFSFAEGTFEVKAVSAVDFKNLYTCEVGATADPSIIIGMLFQGL